MFSTKNLFFAAVAICLASTSFAALPQTLTTCDASSTFKVTYKFENSSMNLGIEGKDENGNPVQGNQVYTINNGSHFTPDSFKAEDLQSIYMVNEIQSFSGGVVMEIAQPNLPSTQIFFFEYEPNQYSAVLFLEQMPLALGKTGNCK